MFLLLNNIFKDVIIIFKVAFPQNMTFLKREQEE